MNIRNPLGLLGSVLAGVAILMLLLSMIFVSTEGTLLGAALIPAFSAIITLATAAWAVWLARSHAPVGSAVAMLSHMTTISFILVAAIAVVVWTRAQTNLPSLFATLVALEGPIAIFLAKRFLNSRADS